MSSKVIGDMARTVSGMQAGPYVSATTSSSRTTHRVSKRAANRPTRQSSRIAGSNASVTYREMTGMEDMASSTHNVAGQSTNEDHGMDTKQTALGLERIDAAAFYRSICPVTDKDDKPFRLMELPTEIRLEIYRACLTRPHSILLSRQLQLNKQEEDHDPETPSDDVTRRASFRVLVAPGARTSSQSTSEPSKSSSRNSLPHSLREDPLLTNVLRVSKEVYKEARGVLYSENYFKLDLSTAQSTLACLHQRSRRQIKHIELEIPSYNDILERFQETVRLSLRYCSGLKECLIHMPFMLPGADGSGTSGNTTVYANGFDILRWLPQECNIILEGIICVEIDQVVNKHRQLARTLDKLAYARRQLISNENAVQQG